MTARVVISPSSTTNPVLVAVSQATRERGSCSRQASNTASLIWSQSLSGCPSVTDSDVNIRLGEVIKVSLMIYLREKRNCPFWDVKGQFTLRCSPSHLPEHPSAGIGTSLVKE